MEHLAILHKKPLQLILEGKKTIESRWSKNKITPYKQIQKGETIYLKQSGGPILAKTKAKQVKFYENLTETTKKQIYAKYGKQIQGTYTNNEYHKNKRYCTLIWLTKITKIKPIKISKKGQSAWITKTRLSRQS